MASVEEENAQLRAELAAMKEDLSKAHDHSDGCTRIASRICPGYY
jgi:uncharacterized protein YigA (DUF484 family)